MASYQSKYTGTQIDAGIEAAQKALPKTGGTMTGALTLAADPTADMHAATKKWVEDYVGNLPSGGGGAEGAVLYNAAQSLTDDQKAQARENIAAAANEEENEYELIETITIAEESVMEIERTAEPNGTKYNFKAIYLSCMAPMAEQKGFMYTYINGYIHADMPGSILSTGPAIGQMMAECKYGMIEGYGIGAPNSGTSTTHWRYITRNNTPKSHKSINALKIRSTVSIPIDTEIKIWGVRA